MKTVDLELTDITEKCVAIVCFGPATPMTGTSAGQYFQVTIDPEKISPSGKYIRFGTYAGDEIIGWQRCEVMTVVEILGKEGEAYKTQGFVTMLKVT